MDLKFSKGAMICLQRIFTVATHQKFSPLQSMRFAKLSVSVCQQLGINGRAFSNDKEAVFIIEGPQELVKKYYHAVFQDPHTDFAVIHFDREIEAAEFESYSVWLSSYDSSKFNYDSSVHLLTSETLKFALPVNLSSKLNIRIKALMPDID